jgi:hypothetical protein
MGLKDPKDNPCWRGYKPVGTKMKNGKEVPNCVPMNEELEERYKAEGDVNYDAIMGYYDEAVDKPKAAADIMGVPPRNIGDNIKMRAAVSEYVLDLSYEEMKEIEQDLGIDPHQDINEYDVDTTEDIREFVEYMREYSKLLQEGLNEAEYQGRKVPLGKPMRGDVKKFKVYVKNPKGKVVKVNFGDPNMKIKKSNPKRRKSFRARHNCANPGPRTKARYWSCRKW